MAIIIAFDLDVIQIDAINAFANRTLDKVVYTYLPDGFKTLGKVLQILRALYSLRRSLLIWLKEFSSTLVDLGLVQVPKSQCLFTNRHLVVFFYVDDVVILYHPEFQTEYQQFRQALLSQYKFKELGTLKQFLGIQIIQDRSLKKLQLYQDSYIKKIARTFNLTDSPYYQTPMATVDILPHQGQASDQDIYRYQRRIGSIMYATTIIRPDTARVSNKLSEYLLNPSEVHQVVANRIIRYLYNTRFLAIQYSASNSTLNVTLDFRCSTNAAFTDDIPTYKSTKRYIFKLFEGPIDQRSTRQKQVTRSLTEAELIALSHTSTKIYQQKRFFNSINLQLDQYKVEYNNQQTIRLLTTSAIKLATKLKHIDIHQHWLRQEVQENRLYIEQIPTVDMPADGLTKALPRQKHQTFLQQLGLVDIKHLLSALDQ